MTSSVMGFKMSTTPSSYMAISSLNATADRLLLEEGRTASRHKGPTARGFLPGQTRPPRTGPTRCGNELAVLQSALAFAASVPDAGQPAAGRRTQAQR